MPRFITPNGLPEMWAEKPAGYFTVEEWLDAQEVPTVDHDRLRQSQLLRISIARKKVQDSGFYVGETLFDSDEAARLAYRELADVLRENPVYTVPWKASRGQWVAMDAELFASVQIALHDHIAACFTWQAQQEKTLDAGGSDIDLSMAASEVESLKEEGNHDAA